MQRKENLSRINFLFWQGGYYRGVAQLGLERLLWEQEAAGSSPVTPTIWGCSLSNPLGFESKQASGNGAGGIAALGLDTKFAEQFP